MNCRAHGRQRKARRGSIYALVLGCALTVSVIGLSAIAAVRLQRHAAEGSNDFIAARLYAQSAIDLAAFIIASESNWRTARAAARITGSGTIGDGTYGLEVTDPADDDIRDSDKESIVIKGTGARGQARYMLQVTMTPQLSALDALQSALHGGLAVSVGSGANFIASGALISSNATLTNSGTITGSAAALVVLNLGTITGTTTILAAARAMPDSSVFAAYTARATVISASGGVSGKVLTPGFSSWGTTNPDGIYMIDTGARDIDLKGIRVTGTLLINCPGKRARINGGVLFERLDNEFAALIVNGDLKLDTTDSVVSEASENYNFNPVGAPYSGTTDADTADTYPNMIRGLIHVRGALDYNKPFQITGAVISEGAVTIGNGSSTVTYDSSLYTNPPMGYFTVSGVAPQVGSWKQLVD